MPGIRELRVGATQEPATANSTCKLAREALTVALVTGQERVS
ncbi:MAG TPA: hypothetical protein VKR42_10445 [Ktedonobacteraceae bacterium]|nr:hypothetical protein [Ktedonobacteraceae bacterium]